MKKEKDGVFIIGIPIVLALVLIGVHVLLTVPMLKGDLKIDPLYFFGVLIFLLVTITISEIGLMKVKERKFDKLLIRKIFYSATYPIYSSIVLGIVFHQAVAAYIFRRHGETLFSGFQLVIDALVALYVAIVALIFVILVNIIWHFKFRPKNS